jgi:AcrR family transcriptional regulator
MESATPKISRERRESRREHILEAALGCFADEGFHQTGMAEIVRRSGISHGAIYSYFRSKDDIIEALADDRHSREAILNAAAASDDPFEGLVALVRAYATSLADPSSELRRRVGVHVWAEALRNPRVRARVVEGIAIPRTLVAGLVARAQSAGHLAPDIDADAMARSLVALFQGITLQVVWGEPVDFDACAEAVERMLRGLAPDARPTPAPRAEA